jgi:mono/diheme cytochrome c family protein
MIRIPRNRIANRVLLLSGVLVIPVLAACGDAEQRTETPAPAVAAATGAEQLYQQRCSSCHQPNGQGVQGTFPPLAGSEYATAANPAVPIRIVLNGMQGPITVHGVSYDGIMPPYGMGIQMSDEEVAAVLSYVRSSWGNQASAVTPQQVAAERAAPRAATGPVTAAELAPLM